MGAYAPEIAGVIEWGRHAPGGLIFALGDTFAGGDDRLKIVVGRDLEPVRDCAFVRNSRVFNGEHRLAVADFGSIDRGQWSRSGDVSRDGDAGATERIRWGDRQWIVVGLTGNACCYNSGREEVSNSLSVNA